MKHLLHLFLLIAISSLFSCKKYEDGPSMSLLSKKSRVANKWKVEAFYVNGEDRTYYYRTIVTRESLQFFKAGNWEYSEVSNWSWAKAYDTGNWNLINKQENLEMTSNDPLMEYKLYKILKLKSKELWLERAVRPDSIIEFHFVPRADDE